MKSYYISNMSGTGGISRYARNFYEHVLQPRGYEFLDSGLHPSDILSQVSSEDIVHLESGIFSYREQEIIERMLKSGYSRVRITMHDPPLFRYPSYQTGNSVLDMVVKCSDLYLGGFRKFRHLLQKAERIYVLSLKGMQAVRNSYGLTGVQMIPHVVPNPVEPKSRPKSPDMMYMGFIGKNKGLEYALEVHAEFIKENPDAKFKIAGTAIGKANAYMASLAKRENRNVQFMGYVPENELEEICFQSAFAFQPFKPYRGYFPVSGSILYCLEKGTLVLATPVNAITEIISDQKNGILLSGNPKKDAQLMNLIWRDPVRYESIRNDAYLHLCKYHAPNSVAEKLVD